MSVHGRLAGALADARARVHLVPGLDSEHTVDQATEPLRRTCQGCGRAGDTERSHRRSRGQGGLWAPSNILRLDRRCHSWAEHHPTDADAAGWRLVHRDTVPGLVPVWCRVPDWAWPAWWLPGDDGVWVWVSDECPPVVPAWADQAWERRAG